MTDHDKARETVMLQRMVNQMARPDLDDILTYIERCERLEEALHMAIGALGDIYDGEPEFDDAGELKWCRNRAKEAAIAIRDALAKGDEMPEKKDSWGCQHQIVYF